MRKLICLFAFYWCFGYSGAQTLPKDSLLNLLPAAREDTNKIKLLFALVSEYVQYNTDSAEMFLAQSKQLVDKLDVHRFDFEYYYEGVKIYHATQEFDKALEYNLKAVQTAERDHNKNDKADALRALFTIYLNLKMDSLAIQTAHETLRLTEELKDTANLPITFGNLARLYYELDQYEKAIEYGKKGIETGKKYHELKALLISMNNTAISYKELGKIKEAEALYKEQLQLAYKNNIARSAVKALINLSFIYVDAGDKQQLNKCTKELNEYVAANSTAPIAKSDLGYLPVFNGYNYLFAQEYDKAAAEAEKGVSGAGNNLNMLLHLYSLLVKINYTKQDYTKAEWWEAKADSIQQVMIDEDHSDYELELSKKFETEKKEAQIQLQEATIKQKNTLNYILIGGAAALLIIFLLAYRNYHNKQKLQQQRIAELETEKQLLATQSLLKGQEEERNRLAKDLHDGLGGLLSGVKLQLGVMKGNLILSEEHGRIFNNALAKLDESISEMRRVAHNMMPEALLNLGLEQALRDYCEGLAHAQPFTIHSEFHGLEKRMQPSDEIVVYRIVQELLNNAVKHAQATSILAQVIKRDGLLDITVEDDGNGFNTADKDFVKGTGFSSIQSRVNYLKGTMDIQSAAGKGTSVHIECKVEDNV